MQTFAGILRDMSEGKRDPQLSDPALAQKRNLHRVIVFRDTRHLPDLVPSALDSDNDPSWNPMAAPSTPRRTAPRRRASRR